MIKTYHGSCHCGAVRFEADLDLTLLQSIALKPGPRGDDESPHWIAIDPTGRRVVLNSGGKGNRLFLVNFDPATGKLTMDERFRDPDDPRPGLNLTGKSWPHGFTGNAAPHGTVFSKGAEK